ncbi:MAG: sigma-70 family RNA polymerase sigma factor, partial [Planctomycetota bacterium]
AAILSALSTRSRLMNETSLSLLQQMRESPVQEAWDRLHALYEPLIRKWLVRYELQASDADDVAQEVLMAISQGVASFEHNGRQGAFRAWIKGVLVNRLRKFWHSRDRRPVASGGSDMNRRLAELDDPMSQISRIWNEEHDQHVLAQLITSVEPQFQPNTWAAFRMTALQGIKPGQAAEKLGLSLNAVLIAKSRVLGRLRQEADGMVDSTSKFSSKA